MVGDIDNFDQLGDCILENPLDPLLQSDRGEAATLAAAHELQVSGAAVHRHKLRRSPMSRNRRIDMPLQHHLNLVGEWALELPGNDPSRHGRRRRIGIVDRKCRILGVGTHRDLSATQVLDITLGNDHHQLAMRFLSVGVSSIGDRHERKLVFELWPVDAGDLQEERERFIAGFVIPDFYDLDERVVGHAENGVTHEAAIVCTYRGVSIDDRTRRRHRR